MMSGKIHFGVYDLDRDAMELRKRGVLIRLRSSLSGCWQFWSGEIVTREELQEQIWGNVFVDFDQSLNKAVNRVREALNDNTGAPQYIETALDDGVQAIKVVRGRREGWSRGTRTDNGGRPSVR